MQTPENIWNNEKLLKTLKDGGVVVMPTDTIYGILGCALSEETVSRIYAARKRDPQKPSIILIGSIKEIEKFFIILSEKQKNKLNEYWPASPSLGGSGPVSIVLDCPDESFIYLHRGTKTLAFRMPTLEQFRNLLVATGPLVAPSANPEGLSPALNISEAKEYFGDAADLYIDGGDIPGKASKVIKLHKDGSITILRE